MSAFYQADINVERMVSDKLVAALDKMDMARAILTKGNPTPECNWGMLDTFVLRAEVEAIRKGEQA
jgi:hypothetical protein